VDCVALGGEIRNSQETVDLLKDYVIQLHRYGPLESALREVPAADGLTTAYLFRGMQQHTSRRSLFCYALHINALKCSGIRWLHLKLFSAIQV